MDIRLHNYISKNYEPFLNDINFRNVTGKDTCIFDFQELIFPDYILRTTRVKLTILDNGKINERKSYCEKRLKREVFI